MRVEEAIKAFEDEARQGMIKLDDTDGIEPGHILSVGNQTLMVMRVIDETDLSVIKHTMGVYH